jgi:LAO/AO transport system kinase
MRRIDERAAGYLDELKRLHPHAGRAYLVGITGTPGAGKSTLVGKLIEQQRALQRRVGVIAVDPASPYSGGAILGDRIRMQAHALDAEVFIRSLSTRGHLGGLSRSAADVARVLDAFGCDVILIETVGVGQDELEIAKLAHTTVVVLAPGGGDDVQAIKAGILEIADVFAVNKADREGADATVRDLEGMLGLSDALNAARFAGHGAGHALACQPAGAAEGWRPPVLKLVAARGQGVAELGAACEQHRAFLAETEAGRAQLAKKKSAELARTFRELLVEGAEKLLGAELDAAAQRAAQGEDPYVLSEALLARLLEA